MRTLKGRFPAVGNPSPLAGIFRLRESVSIGGALCHSGEFDGSTPEVVPRYMH